MFLECAVAACFNQVWNGNNIVFGMYRSADLLYW